MVRFFVAIFSLITFSLPVLAECPLCSSAHAYRTLLDINQSQSVLANLPPFDDILKIEKISKDPHDVGAGEFKITTQYGCTIVAKVERYTLPGDKPGASHFKATRTSLNCPK